MPYLLTALIILLALLLFLAAFVLIRTTMFGKPIAPAEPVEGIKLDPPVVAEHLAAVLRKATISDADPQKVDWSTFAELHHALEGMYPRVHATLEKRTVNQYGLLYTWAGRKPELEPVLLAAHIDVVPVEAAGLEEWAYPPFSGQVAEGFVWGRGALDIKSQVIAILEAVENLLKEGYRPQRTIYLAFGHDEEINGVQGAGSIAQLLADEGVHLQAVLDEGGAILESLLPGIKSAVATVGVAEKGYLSLELAAEGQPGHSSTPPAHTAIGVLAAGLARLETSPMPLHVEHIVPMMEHLGAVLPFSLQLAFANRWLLGGLLRRRLAENPRTAAAIRTTQAVTMISGGVKDNLLPRAARVVVNFRLLPGDSVASVCDHVRRALGDERIQFHPIAEAGVREASPVSPTDSEPYQSLARVIRAIFPEAVAAPYLVLGATDSRYYAPICEHVFRFSPITMRGDDLNRVHGTDERIGVEDLARMAQFFAHLARTWGG